MIEVTNREIADSMVSLSMLSGMKLPVLVGLQVCKLVSKLREPAKIIDEVHNSLIDRYGQKQKTGEIAVIFPNDLGHRPESAEWKKFREEDKLLMAQTVELDTGKIQLPSKIDGKPLQIEPSILIALEKFLDVV